MKKKIITAIIFIIIISSSANTIAFEMNGRTLGMGGAFTGLADDLSALFYNPAGLGQNSPGGLQLNVGVVTDGLDQLRDSLEIYDNIGQKDFDAATLISKLPDRIVIDAQINGEVNIKSIAVGYKTEQMVELSSDETGNKPNASWTSTGQGVFAYGYQVLSPPLKIAELYLGGALKILNTNRTAYNIYDSTVAGLPDRLYEYNTSGNGLDLDVGILARVTPLVTVGLQVKNLLGSDYQLQGTKTSKQYDIPSGSWVDDPTEAYVDPNKVKNDRVTRVGASFFLPVIDLTMVVDIDRFPLLTDGDNDPNIHFGIEKNLLLNGVSIRAGAFNQGADNYITIGLGLNLSSLHLDMAVASGDDFSSDFCGIISGSIKF